MCTFHLNSLLLFAVKYQYLFVCSGQDISLNATYHLGAAFGQQDNLQEAEYTDDAVNLGAEGCEEGDVEAEGYQHVGEEEYTHEYSHGDNTEMPDDQMDYTGEPAEGDEGYQDEVLDIQINETLDGEFQVSSHICLLRCMCAHKHTQAHTLIHIPCPRVSVPLFCSQEMISVFLSR